MKALYSAIPFGPASRLSASGVGPSIRGFWRSTIVGLVLATALCGACGQSRAAGGDNALTLDLPPSAAAQQAHGAEEAHTSVVPQRMRAVTVRPRTGTPSRGGFQRETVVGRLGQLVRVSSLFRTRSRASQRLTTAPAGTYLAIEGELDGWFAILMADGSTGWVTADRVNELQYQVVSPGPVSAAPSVLGAGDTFAHGNAVFFAGDANRLLNEAYKYLGVRYEWGGNTSRGIDCSGFVKKVFGACGYPLPRLGSEQMAYGLPVSPAELRAGDRLYFGRRRDGAGVTHTGIYIGNGLFIHSSSSRGGVAVSSLSEAMFARIYVCARR